jgi:hypothetical protein
MRNDPNYIYYKSIKVPIEKLDRFYQEMRDLYDSPKHKVTIIETIDSTVYLSLEVTVNITYPDEIHFDRLFQELSKKEWYLNE